MKYSQRYQDVNIFQRHSTQGFFASARSLQFERKDKRGEPHRMEKPLQFYIETLQDPFTLLKVCQLLRESSAGQSVKLLIKGKKIPGELQKILTPESYQITIVQSLVPTNHIEIVIKKRNMPLSQIISPAGNGEGCCS